MAKPRSTLVDYCVYVLVRIFVALVHSMSFGFACKLAEHLAWVLHHVNRRHRLVALDNLRQAFPGKYSEEELDVMVRHVYRHFCVMLVEILYLPRLMHPTNWKRYMDLPGGRKIVDCLLSGRPLLIITGHFGNWEIAGIGLGLFGFTTHAIARPLDNPFLDKFLRSFREKTGQKILAKQGDFDNIENTLKTGGVIATLGDQDAGQKGLFVDFFGRPASTHKAIALLALEHRVPMAVVGVAKSAGRYHVEVADAIFPEEYDGRPDAVKAITQRFTSALETVVCAAPQQYFWLHRRWKHQPKSKTNKKAA